MAVVGYREKMIEVARTLPQGYNYSIAVCHTRTCPIHTSLRDECACDPQIVVTRLGATR